MIHRVDSAIVVHQETLRVNPTVVYNILCPNIVTIKVPKVIADLNGVF